MSIAPLPPTPGPAPSSTDPTLRAIIELRLHHLGRSWPWLVGVRHQGHPVIKKTNFTYPKGGGSSHRKTSLPQDPCWAALFGAVSGLGAEATAALILAWQWERARALRLPWLPGVPLSDVLASNPPTPAEFLAFDMGRAAALERDLCVAFAHPAVSNEYGAARHLVAGLAKRAATGRWYAKPIFDSQGRVAPHLLPAGKAAALPAPAPAPTVVAVPKAEAVEALFNIGRLASGISHVPLTFDFLCGFPGFGSKAGADLDHPDHMLVRYGMVTTRGDQVALQQRQGGPWRYGLFEVGVPDLASAAAISRQALVHPWRTLAAGRPASVAPWGLLVHRPADDFPTIGPQFRPRPILLTALWRASLKGADDPLPAWTSQEAVRWERAEDLLNCPAGLMEDADRCILSCLRRPGSLPVIDIGTAQMVDFTHPQCRQWREGWASA